jgi:ATP/maltotriose-dependent transcriptional regulator MalT
MSSDPLAAARDLYRRCEWQAAHNAAEAAGDAGQAERSELLADAEWWLGRLDDCIEHRQTAYHNYMATGRLRDAGRCATWLYEHYRFRSRPAMATAWLQRARRALDDENDCVEQGRLALREAEAAHDRGDLDAALAFAEGAFDCGRRYGSTDLEGDALQAMGRLLIDGGRVHEGLAHLDEAMLLVLEGRIDSYTTGKVYCSLVSACEDVGDLRRAAEWTEASAAWADQHPFAVFPGICRIHRAVVLDRRGALADAEREATRACTELVDIHRPDAAAAFAHVGDVRRRLGDLERAEEAFARAEELSGGPCCGLALLRLAQGHVATAMRVIRRCVDEQRGASPFARLQSLPAFVEIAVASGELDDASRALAELESIAAHIDTEVAHAVVLTARGQLQLAQGDPRGACATLRTALTAWHQLEMPYEAATTRAHLAGALREAGEDGAAAATLAAARQEFDGIGAPFHAFEARRGPEDGALPAGLTYRELDVLRLVAAGRTNKAIAAELHISGKTVSRHLDNIFSKLGVTSRTAATAFAYQQDLVT